MVREAREAGVTIPLVLMSYCNPILRFGMDAFARTAQEAGVDGLIVPDLPLEEAGPLAAECRAHALDLILLAAPTTTEQRLRTIAEATRGFLYLVGVTGARDRVSHGLHEFIRRVRALTSKPACVGFGIANAETARAVAQCASGVIIGSALVSIIDLPERAVSAAQEFIRELRIAIEAIVIT
jgi:tryptophan synthase alpha chain